MSTSIILMLVVSISKAFGFIREMIIASYYGASLEMDAFNVAQSIPLVLFAAVGASVTSALLPIYTELFNKNKNDSHKFVSNLWNICLLISVIIVIICIVYSSSLVRLFAPNMSLEGIKLASRITKIISFVIIPTILYNLFLGVLNVHKKFYISQIAAIPCSLIIIMFIVLGYSKMGIWAAVIGTIVGTVFQVLIQLPYIIKRIKYKPIIFLKNKDFNRFIVLAIPMIISISLQQINGIVDKIIGSSLEIGSISALNYAYKLISFVYGVFGLSIMTILYTKFSGFAAFSNKKQIGILLKKGLIIVFATLLPITIITMTSSLEIVSIIYGRGEFNKTAINLTTLALFYYAIGMIPMIFIDIINRAFYSLKNSKTTLIITSIGVIINVILNIILTKYLEIGGIALGTSISTWLVSIILLLLINKRVNFNFKEFLIDITKLIIISIPTTILAIYLNNVLQIKYVFKFTVISLVVFSIYMVLIMVVKITDIETELKKLKKNMPIVYENVSNFHKH